MKYIRTENSIKKFTDEKYKIHLESKKTPASRKLEKIKKLKDYLSNTDWYAIRSIDGGEYPQEVKNNRIAARQAINDIEDTKTEEEVNNINIDFIGA